jgi:hypothetical protein
MGLSRRFFPSTIKDKFTLFDLVFSNPNTRDWTGVTYSPTLGRAVAVGNDNLAYSDDGLNWTTVTPPQANFWRDVTWSPSLAIYCAVSSNGTNRVMTSSDGINWSLQTASLAGQWVSITWSESLGLFCASRTGGEFNNPFMTSSNGTSWTTQTLPTGEVLRGNRVQWNEDIEEFLSVGSSGTYRAFSSSDGITWVDRTTTENNFQATGLFSHPEQTLFFIGAQAGAGPVRHAFTRDVINYSNFNIGGGTHLGWIYNKKVNRIITIANNLNTANPMPVVYITSVPNGTPVNVKVRTQKINAIRASAGTYMDNVERSVFVSIDGFVADNL